MTQPAVMVTPNVPGDIIVGDNNFKVNNNYGTIVYKQAGARVKLRAAVPQPPRKPRDFVGRNAELAELEKRIAANEAVLVYGPDGLGKTALLKQAANGLAARALPQGVLLLEGMSASGLGLDDLSQQLFDALYESEPPQKVTVTSARTYLSNNRPLVLIDNLALPATALATLVDMFPQGALLFASQSAPTGDTALPLKLGPLAGDDAIKLLATKLGVEVGDDNRTDLMAICGLLGDVPLAILTAANTIRERNLHLPQVRETLTNIANTEPIARAYEFTRLNLTATERSLIAIAANTPSVSVDPDWLRTASNDPKDFDTSLMSLQARELLVANSPRLRVAPGLRALAQLNAEGRDDLLQRLSQYLLDRLSVRDTDYEYCASELSNILAVIDWAIRRGLWTMALNLGRAIDPFVTLTGKWDAWKFVLEHCLTAARGKGDGAAEGWALHQLGTREMGVGIRDTALDLLNKALGLRQRLGDSVGMAYTQHNLNLLLPPPLAPRGNGSTPKALSGAGPIPPIVLLTVAGGVGLAFVIAAILALVVIFNANRPPSTPIVPPIATTETVLKPTDTMTPTVTATFTATVTETATATFTPTATETPAPIVFIVTVPDDLVDIKPGDGKCEYKPGICSLRAAVMEANQQVGRGPVEIVVPEGSYTLRNGADDDTAVEGDLDLHGELTIRGAGADKTFILNGGLDATGRLLQVVSGASVTIEGVSLDGGNAKTGGGIQIDKNAALDISASSLTGNFAVRGGGLSNDGTLTMAQSVIFGNTANECGGGLYNAGRAELTNVTFFQNLTNANGLADVVAGQGAGGGICNVGALRLESVSVVDNIAKGQGANIFNAEKLEVHNTLVVNGACTGPLISLGFNLAGPGSGACLKLFQAQGDTQTDGAVVDLSLADNGGHILSLALIAESPALDAGDPAQCPNVDGRGLPRKDGRCDIGAYEAP